MNMKSMVRWAIAALLAGNVAWTAEKTPAGGVTLYADGRPSATLRMEAKDQGVVLKHGDGPGQCDYLGAREALIFEEKGVYHLFHDGAGPTGWLAAGAHEDAMPTEHQKGRFNVLCPRD